MAQLTASRTPGSLPVLVTRDNAPLHDEEEKLEDEVDTALNETIWSRSTATFEVSYGLEEAKRLLAVQEGLLKREIPDTSEEPPAQKPKIEQVIREGSGICSPPEAASSRSNSLDTVASDLPHLTPDPNQNLGSALPARSLRTQSYLFHNFR